MKDQAPTSLLPGYSDARAPVDLAAHALTQGGGCQPMQIVRGTTHKPTMHSDQAVAAFNADRMNIALFEPFHFPRCQTQHEHYSVTVDGICQAQHVEHGCHGDDTLITAS